MIFIKVTTMPEKVYTDLQNTYHRLLIQVGELLRIRR